MSRLGWITLTAVGAIALGLAGLLWTGYCAPPPAGTPATVARVVSGQTFEVLLGGRAETTAVRLAGLNAPDLDQLPWGAEAKQHLEDWLLQQSITLEAIADADPYGRQLAYAWFEEQMVNEALVAEGYAMAGHPQSKYAHCLAHAQHQARLLGLGIWNPANPMRQTPVEFRQQSPSAL